MKTLPCLASRGLLVGMSLTATLATLPAQEQVLVQQGSPMVFQVNETNDPGIGLAWVEPGFDDSAWTTGTYGVGYDAGSMIETELGSPLIASVYTRSTFEISDLDALETIHLGADYDDAFAAWINGVEVARVNLDPTVTLEWNTPAEGNHESSNSSAAQYESIVDITTAIEPYLVEGENLLAIGAWNIDPDSSDLALVPLVSLNRPGPISGTNICGTLTSDTTLSAEYSPYQVTCDVTVPKGVMLTIEAGVEVYFDGGTELVVEGQLYALGESDNRVQLTRNIGGGNWSGLTIDHSNDGDPRESVLRNVDLAYASTLLDVNDTGESPVLVEDCRLDHWTSLAVHWDTSHGLVLRRCEFGLNTPLSEAGHEAINGYRAGTIVEYCTFGRRTGYNDVIDLGDTSWGEPVPTVRYNTFLGGDDDAIDYDGSAGWITGNLIMDMWPRPGASSSANGGGITGNDASNPVVTNNIVYHCFHGIGYKNGSSPLVANNLVLDCNVGVTFYKDACDRPPPTPVLYNNIIWNNFDATTGADRNLVLNGRWFPDYCQDEEDQAIVDITYSIVQGGWPGEGNLDLDPRIADPGAGDFSLLLDSPALDSGFGGPFMKTGVDPGLLATALGTDRTGHPREDLDCVADSGTGDITFLDRGPNEAATELCPPDDTPRFVRGDAGGDAWVDISDAVWSLFTLFGRKSTDCVDALDANDDGLHDLTDPIVVLEYLFLRGPAPAAPFPEAGPDLSVDSLGCVRGLP